jgi:hypothetical protein
MERRFLFLFITLDQFLFCFITFGKSYPDETASAAAWRLEQNGKWQGKFFRPVIDWIARVVFSDPEHCQVSYDNEIAGTNSVRFNVVRKKINVSEE